MNRRTPIFNDALFVGAKIFTPSRVPRDLAIITAVYVLPFPADACNKGAKPLSRINPMYPPSLLFFSGEMLEATPARDSTEQYLAEPASSASPERLFSSVGLVKSDLRGRPKFWTPPWST